MLFLVSPWRLNLKGDFSGIPAKNNMNGTAAWSSTTLLLFYFPQENLSCRYCKSGVEVIPHSDGNISGSKRSNFQSKGKIFWHWNANIACRLRRNASLLCHYSIEPPPPTVPTTTRYKRHITHFFLTEFQSKMHLLSKHHHQRQTMFTLRIKCAFLKLPIIGRIMAPELANSENSRHRQYQFGHGVAVW